MSFSTSCIAGYTYYIVLSVAYEYESTSKPQNIWFRVNRTDIKGDTSNSAYDLYTSKSYTANNMVHTGNIMYKKDVDCYYINNQIAGDYEIAIKNNSSTPIEYTIQERYEDTWNETDDFLLSLFNLADNSEGMLGSHGGVTKFVTFKKSGDYFIKIKAASNYINSYNLSYTIEISAPDKPDEFEPNNTPKQATMISDYTNMDVWATLHHNDVDYYQFTTGNKSVKVNYIDLFIRRLNYSFTLYTYNTASNTKTQVAKSVNQCVEDITLQPNTVYLIEVVSDDGIYSAKGQNEYNLTSSMEEVTTPTPDPGTEIKNPNVVFEIMDYNDYFDWAACAIMVGNAARDKENLTSSWFVAEDIAAAVNASETARPNPAQVAGGANVIYANNTTTPANLFRKYSSAEVFENLETIIPQQPLIAILGQKSGTSYNINTGMARYVVIAGVNIAGNKLYIMDPLRSQAVWVDKDDFYTNGYNGTDYIYKQTIKYE